MIKYHNQSNLCKEKIIWVYGSRGEPLWWGGMAAGRKLSAHSLATSRKRREPAGSGVRLLISQYSLSDTLPPTRQLPPKQHHRLGNKCSHTWVCGGRFSFKTPQAPNQKSERWKPSGTLVFGAHNCPELFNRALSNNFLLTLCPYTCHPTQQLTMAGIKPWEGVLKLEGPGGKSTGMNLQANEEHQSKALNRAHVKHDLCISRGQRCRPRAADWRDY